MTDTEKRDKVMRGLMACGCSAGVPNICEVMECPYRENPCACVHLLAQDALALIEEQRDRIKGLLECATILSDALDEKEDSDAE